MDNPSAFPDDKWQNGMTLLDYFAGQALIGLCSNPGTASLTPEWNSEQAYLIAKTMLNVREKWLKENGLKLEI